MGKLQLKKEIQALPREQLEAMILEAYDARKEIKQYFDYFINPDVEKLTDKYMREISGEFSRSKRGYTKARITNIRRLYKEFQGYHPGFDKEIELLMHVITIALQCERQYYFPDTLIRGIRSIVILTVEIADRNLVADKVLAQLAEILSQERYGTKHFRSYLYKALQEVRPS